MPITKEEFENEDGKLHSKMEEEIISFLNERKEKAFTSQEIVAAGIQYHPDFSTPEIAKMSTFAIANFATLIYDLVRKGKIKMKFVKCRMYFIAEGYVAKCPKCGIETAEPKKTWKMAGRPDKRGKRLQLHIGLFKCPKHGAFRAVLAKQKI